MDGRDLLADHFINIDDGAFLEDKFHLLEGNQGINVSISQLRNISFLDRTGRGIAFCPGQNVQRAGTRHLQHHRCRIHPYLTPVQIQFHPVIQHQPVVFPFREFQPKPPTAVLRLQISRTARGVQIDLIPGHIRIESDIFTRTVTHDNHIEGGHIVDGKPGHQTVFPNTTTSGQRPIDIAILRFCGPGRDGECQPYRRP